MIVVPFLAAAKRLGNISRKTNKELRFAGWPANRGNNSVHSRQTIELPRYFGIQGRDGTPSQPANQGTEVSRGTPAPEPKFPEVTGRPADATQQGEESDTLPRS